MNARRGRRSARHLIATMSPRALFWAGLIGLGYMAACCLIAAGAWAATTGGGTAKLVGVHVGGDVDQDLSAWVARVGSDKGQPAWKRAMAGKLRAGNCRCITMRATRYSDRDELDPDGRRRDVVRLRYGMIAADLMLLPAGTVVLVGGPYWRSMVVTDCGPAVRGAHLDVYCPDRATWRAHGRCEKATGGHLPIWVLGRISRADTLAAYRNG